MSAKALRQVCFGLRNSDYSSWPEQSEHLGGEPAESAGARSRRHKDLEFHFTRNRKSLEGELSGSA